MKGKCLLTTMLLCLSQVHWYSYCEENKETITSQTVQEFVIENPAITIVEGKICFDDAVELKVPLVLEQGKIAERIMMCGTITITRVVKSAYELRLIDPELVVLKHLEDTKLVRSIFWEKGSNKKNPELFKQRFYAIQHTLLGAYQIDGYQQFGIHIDDDIEKLLIKNSKRK